MHDSCRCPQCFGLRELMLETTGKDYGLAPAPGHLPDPDPLKPVCTGQLTCTCPDCQAQRAQLTRAGSRDRPQPWDVRAA